jgi:hypothetical protein
VEDVTGRRRESLAGRRWYDEFVPAADRDRIRAAFVTVTEPEEGSPRYLSPAITHHDPAGRLEWSLLFFRSAEGNVTGATCVGQPVKEA